MRQGIPVQISRPGAVDPFATEIGPGDALDPTLDSDTSQ
jgi:hypothetical protein